MTPNDALAKSLLPVPTNFCPAGLEVVARKAGRLLPGDTTMIPLNGEVRLPPGPSGPSCF